MPCPPRAHIGLFRPEETRVQDRRKGKREPRQESGMKGRAAAEPGRREPPRVHMKHKDEFFKKKKRKSKGCGEGDKRKTEQ